MTPTDTEDPEFYHRIVDCQYACPAHTPVPEYIRLIAQKRYTEAYVINRNSNVFPGILGRVCDRPCEPACRRGRIDEEPVAICRLKRVAADFKGDIQNYLPKIPGKKNGKKIALIGAGPASLTVANDLAPLGYDLTLFDQEHKPGGAMRAQVPAFRLPETVLDEEIDYILNLGVHKRFGTKISSLEKLLPEFDAIFIGTGAPKGKDLQIPGRHEFKNHIHIGIEFLANIAFEHFHSLNSTVIVIGGGNTAMDCARTALRIGATAVTIVTPESYEDMLASPWEREEAEEEGITIINNLLPKAFLGESQTLSHMQFTHLKSCVDEKGQWAPQASGEGDKLLSACHVILAIGQQVALPFIEETSGVHCDEKTKLPFIDKKTFQSTNPKVFFGGDAAFGPKNIIWAVAHGHEVALSIDRFLTALDVKERPLPQMNLVSQKMGLHQWSYSNAHAEDTRYKVPSLPLKERVKTRKAEVEKGFDVELACKEAERCLNCDMQTVFVEPACIECDACIDICPVDCLSITQNSDEMTLRNEMKATNPEQALFISLLPQTDRVMVKDENLCLHCGLCAERCPTGAWDMQQFTLQLKRAGESS